MLIDFHDQQFDIIVHAGQSNAVGYGFGSMERPYHPTNKVWYLEGDYILSEDRTEFHVNPTSDFYLTWARELAEVNEIRSNFSLAFAQAYMDHGMLSENRKILIIRSAVGGSGFLSGEWHMEGPFYQRMMEMIRNALALNPENRLVALLWHQGENDARLNASYEVHYEHLKKLLYSVRDEFHVPQLPFITADLVQDWKSQNIEICTPVVEAMKGLCREYNYGRFVETDGLKSNYQETQRPGDTIHFSRKSIYELGMRYFEAFLDIINQK